nr:flagellar biosynthesis protein FlhB [uncultured Cellulosilyticum sp.]
MNKQLITLDLQFFSAESEGRTEKATSKKREDSRKKGQVAKSNDLNTAVIIVGFCGAMTVLGSYMLNQITRYIKYSFLHLGDNVQIQNESYLLLNIGEGIKSLLIICVPLWLILGFVAFIISYIQVGFKVTWEPMQPKFSKMNPMNGFKRMFSKDMIVNLLISTAKVSVLGTVVYKMIIAKVPLFLKFYDMSIPQIFKNIGGTILNIGFFVGGAFLILAVLDYVYQRYKHEDSIKMTKQEIKEEYKNAEGDPQIKGKIRQKMREGSMRRMMQAVPDADVIITNPTHFAVAIKYDPEKGSAPVVVAKGVDYVAQKIKEKAKECNIQIVENRPLARSLYYTVDLDREIPPELYGAVAEVLAFVYNLENKHKK